MAISKLLLQLLLEEADSSKSIAGHGVRWKDTFNWKGSFSERQHGDGDFWRGCATRINATPLEGLGIMNAQRAFVMGLQAAPNAKEDNTCCFPNEHT